MTKNEVILICRDKKLNNVIRDKKNNPKNE